MTNKSHLFYGAIGVIIAAVFILCISFIDFSFSALAEYNVEFILKLTALACLIAGLFLLLRCYHLMHKEREHIWQETIRRLAQNERENAWQEMARQIAHEIKNPLTPMRLSLQHLLRLKKDGAPGWIERFEEVLHTLLEEINTLAKTASEFSSFAKTTSTDPVIIDLNKIIQERRPLFDNYPNIKLSINTLEYETNIKAHHNRINRVLTNILTNAVQALKNKEDGEIVMNLQTTGKFHCITIEDNGAGVDKAIEPHLFTPNFTTKKSGSGLGLAICRNIVESYGGTITYSHSGMGGACFTICIPKAS